MKRRTMQSGYFSLIAPALGTRELKHGSSGTGSTSSSSTGTGSASKNGGGGGGGGADPCAPLIGCFTLPLL